MAAPAVILDATEAHLICYMGWVDHGAVWWCETSTARPTQVKLSEATRLTLYPGSSGRFAVVHHFDGKRLEISAHASSSPAVVLSGIRTDGPRAFFGGDLAVWADLPHAYLASDGATDEPILLLIDPAQQAVEWQGLDWFDSSYDRMYQAVVSVIEVPGTPLLLFTVQRSTLILYDPNARMCVKKIALAGRAGNPAVRFRRTAAEVWVTDYDTLLRLDAKTWSIRNSARLQGPTIDGPDIITRAFMATSHSTVRNHSVRLPVRSKAMWWLGHRGL